MDATVLRDAEGKYRTNAKIKGVAAKIYARWGSLCQTRLTCS